MTPLSQNRLTMSASDWALLIVLSVFWGGSFFFTGLTVREIPPLTGALGRVAIAGAALFVVVLALRQSLPRTLEAWKPIAVFAVLNNVVPFSLLFWGQTHIASGLASILNATAPLFTIVVANFATADDRLTPARLVGLVVGFAGVVIMLGPDLFGAFDQHVLAQLACLTAAFFYAVSSVYGRRFRAQPPAALACSQMMVSTLVFIPIVVLVEQPWTMPAPSAQALWALAGVGLISTAAAYLIYFRILARAGATNLMLVTFLIPVSAILLGTLFLGEMLEPRHFAGMAAIAVGLLAIDGRPGRALARLMRA
jgi:drug/metabolite transporter (DMT)-like permease